MDIDSEVQEIFRGTISFLSPEGIVIVRELMSHDELHLAIEYICDQLVENCVHIPYELGTKIQKVSESMGLDPERTWASLTVSKNAGQEVWRFTTEKDELELFDEVNEIYQHLKDRVDLEGDGSAHDFLIHGEYALAIDTICGALKLKRIPITRELATKIRVALLDTKCKSNTLAGIVIKDE